MKVVAFKGMRHQQAVQECNTCRVDRCCRSAQIIEAFLRGDDGAEQAELRDLARAAEASTLL